MRNNVGPARHSIWIQCGTEWIVLFAKPIQYGKISDMEQIWNGYGTEWFFEQLNSWQAIECTFNTMYGPFFEQFE